MSQTNSEKTKIGDKEYEMYMLPPMQSHDLLMDVAKMVGPALGPLIDALFSKATGKGADDLMGQELGTDFFTKAAGALFSGVDKSILKNVIDTFKEITFVGGTPLKGIFEAHYLGKLDEMYKWIGWGMRVQWGKSLNALVSVINLPSLQSAQSAQASQSQIASTG